MYSSSGLKPRVLSMWFIILLSRLKKTATRRQYRISRGWKRGARMVQTWIMGGYAKRPCRARLTFVAILSASARRRRAWIKTAAGSFISAMAHGATTARNIVPLTSCKRVSDRDEGGIRRWTHVVLGDNEAHKILASSHDLCRIMDGYRGVDDLVLRLARMRSAESHREIPANLSTVLDVLRRISSV
jgi:hypothetical protein